MKETDKKALNALDRHHDANWSRVRRLSLIRREVRETLSPEAVNLLLRHAQIMVEGSVEPTSTGRDRFYATVMVTVDLRDLGEDMAEPMDEVTAQKIASLVPHSPTMREELVRIAIQRMQGVKVDACEFGRSDIEVRARAEQSRVLIDGDAVVSLDFIREMHK